MLEDLRKDDLALQFAMSEAEHNSALGRMLLKAIEEDSISVSPSFYCFRSIEFAPLIAKNFRVSTFPVRVDTHPDLQLAPGADL